MAYSYDCFRLGFNLEEFYCIFGEQMQSQVGGLHEALYESTERKASWIRDTLVGKGFADDIVLSLMQIEGLLVRGVVRGRTDESRVDSILESMKAAAKINELMNRIRSELSEIDGLLYDIGVFTARISLCAKMILYSQFLGARQSSIRDIYERELTWAGGRLNEIWLEAEGAKIPDAAFETPHRDRLRALSVRLRLTGQAPEAHAAAIDDIVEELLASLGFTPVIGKALFSGHH